MSALGLLISNTRKELSLNPGKAFMYMNAAALYKDDLLDIGIVYHHLDYTCSSEITLLCKNFKKMHFFANLRSYLLILKNTKYPIAGSDH